MYALTCYGIKFGWETLRCCCSIETWVCNNTKEIKYLDLKKKKKQNKTTKTTLFSSSYKHTHT